MNANGLCATPPGGIGYAQVSDCPQSGLVFLLGGGWRKHPECALYHCPESISRFVMPPLWTCCIKFPVFPATLALFSIDGKALARWILETDPCSMRNLIPGQIKLMFQAVDTMNTGYISFWGMRCHQCTAFSAPPSALP